MSLINQMLKDLEKRSKHATHPDVVLTGLEVPAVRAKNDFRLYFLLLGLLTLSSILLWNIIHSYLQNQLHLPAVTMVSAQAKSPIVVAPLPTAKAVAELNPGIEQTAATLLTSVNGITLQVEGNKTYLRFLLSQPTAYQVKLDAAQHLVILDLKNTHLAAGVPQLDYLNSALRNMDVSLEDKEGLKITLMLNADAKLDNLTLNKDGSFPELQVDFLTTKTKLSMEDSGQTKETVLDQQIGTLKKTAIDLTADQAYQQALSFSQEGKPELAIPVLANILDKNINDYSARELLVTLLLQKGELGEASGLLAEGLRQQPFYPPFIQLKARILVNEGRIAQAIKVLQKSPPELNENPDYYAFIAALYQRQGEFSAAAKLYEQLTTLRPDKGVWWLGLGVALDGMGKNNQAVEAYTKADGSQDLTPELRGYIGARLRT